MDTLQKGDFAQLKVELRAIEKGLCLSKPLRDSSRYDFVLDDGGKLLRVQVKYADGVASHTEGAVCVNLRKQTGAGYRKIRKIKRYDETEIDLLLVYIPKKDVICCFGPKNFSNRSTLQIRLEKPKINISVNYYEDYLW